MDKFQMESLLQIELSSLCLLLDINRFSQVSPHGEIVFWHGNCPIILLVVHVGLFCYDV